MSQEKLEIKKESSEKSFSQKYDSAIEEIESMKIRFIKEMEEKIEKDPSAVEELTKLRQEGEVSFDKILSELKEKLDKIWTEIKEIGRTREELD